MPEALPSVPGFSEQQVHGLINIVHSIMQQYFASSNQPPPNQPSSNQTTPAPIPFVETSLSSQNQPSSTPSAPQETQKEEDEQHLYQATVESTTESTTKHGSNMPNRKSTLSRIPRLCTARSSEDSAAYLSNTLLLACLPGYTLLGYTLLGYIEHSKGLEAIGQG